MAHWSSSFPCALRLCLEQSGPHAHSHTHPRPCTHPHAHPHAHPRHWACSRRGPCIHCLGGDAPELQTI
ncbi:uncharacterized protein ACA1_220480 [Acanthamoeba castellanii str. Neff]|uniref:Uncharacterized protein n=1 Tax=Acanthamoeba castellanii (strain ATCC 30010 / Neff) TaxID=1257118 RepID=L8GQ33_ACACF|nr:uncharacterized protein ACA1_220480 [Acanthamoeba castellanii str. Neff]ELR15289.1 hypothetical protein ACA1_220480 [Acanthamoeba castellanii str. Neff]